MPYFFGYLTLGVVILIIDAAALTDLIKGIEPNYALELGFLVFSFIYFMGGSLFYYKKWLEKQDEPPKPRF